MYPHFIQVHRSYNGESWETAVNIDNIITIEDHNIIANNCSKENKDEESYWVEETYEELLQLLQDCGCHIEKADPRLDNEHHLDMATIRTMLGEPVWNSNLRTWALVHYYDPEINTIQLVNPAGKIYMMGESDLIRFPLYRMQHVSH